MRGDRETVGAEYGRKMLKKGQKGEKTQKKQKKFGGIKKKL